MDAAANNRPAVGVVIVNHNLKDSLRETLQSFRKVNYPGLQVVVSDNASTDGSREMVRQEFSEVHLLPHDPEKGYAKAAALGMEFLADNTKYIFSTSNDVIVEPEMIDVLVDYAEREPKAGVLGCKIYYFGKDLLWSAGGRFSPIFGRVRHFGWNRPDAPRYNHIRECDFVTGCGILVRSDVVKKVNYLNPELIFYCEDADLCYRVREQGYKIVYIPSARMWHKTSTTLAKNRERQLHYSTRNSLYLIQWHRIGYYPVSLLMYLFVVCTFKMLLFAAAFRWKNSVGIWKGIRDWRAGKLGWIRD
jgi:GT2 family glycosyltransferase